MSQTQDRTKEANRIVRTHTYTALAVGLVPLPLVDMAVLSAIQVKLLHNLARLYEVDFSKQLGKSTIAASVSGGAIYPVISLAKFIPVAGWLATMGASRFLVAFPPMSWAKSSSSTLHPVARF